MVEIGKYLNIDVSKSASTTERPSFIIIIRYIEKMEIFLTKVFKLIQVQGKKFYLCSVSFFNDLAPVITGGSLDFGEPKTDGVVEATFLVNYKG